MQSTWFLRVKPQLLWCWQGQELALLPSSGFSVRLQITSAWRLNLWAFIKHGPRWNRRLCPWCGSVLLYNAAHGHGAAPSRSSAGSETTPGCFGGAAGPSLSPEQTR